VNGSALLHHPLSEKPSSVRVESPPRSTRRLPRHIRFIPDGNRRWAVQQGLSKDQGYSRRIAPGLALFEACKALGIEDVRSTDSRKTTRAAQPSVLERIAARQRPPRAMFGTARTVRSAGVTIQPGPSRRR